MLAGFAPRYFPMQQQQQQQQQQTGGPKVPATTLWLKTGMEVAQNDRGGNKHHHEQVSCCFEPRTTWATWFDFGRLQRTEWCPVCSDRGPEGQMCSFDDQNSLVPPKPWEKRCLPISPLRLDGNRGAIKVHCFPNSSGNFQLLERWSSNTKWHYVVCPTTAV